MRLTIMAYATLSCYGRDTRGTETWSLDPAVLTNTHGWPHGDVRKPFFARAQLNAGVYKRIK